MLMNIKNLNFFRGRLINFRLFGNLRWGIYKEISVAEIVEFIAEFRDYCAARDGQGAAEQQVPALPPLDNFRILQRLCEQYYVYEGTERFQQKIVAEVREMIEGLRSDDYALKELEAWLDRTQDAVVAKLRRGHPELKEQEIRLFCYLSAGFTPTMISVLLNKDKSVVYNRVSRLKAKIGQG